MVWSRSVAASVVCAALCVAVAALGCAEDPPPKNELPRITGAQHVCESPMVVELTGEVLTGGELTTLDENLVSVTVEIGGLGARALSTTPLGEEEDPLVTPQVWTFTVDPSERVLCNESLVLTFTATDEKGETARLALTARP